MLFDSQGFNLSFDQVSIQGMRNSNRSVSQYYVKTSTDNNNFKAIEEGGRIKVIIILLAKNFIQARTCSVISQNALFRMWSHENIITRNMIYIGRFYRHMPQFT